MWVSPQANNSAFSQALDDAFGQLLRFLAAREQMDFRRFRCLIGSVDASEIFESASLRFGIETFRVTAHAFIDGRVNEDLDEVSFRHELSHHVALGAVGRDE